MSFLALFVHFLLHGFINKKYVQTHRFVDPRYLSYRRKVIDLKMNG